MEAGGREAETEVRRHPGTPFLSVRTPLSSLFCPRASHNIPARCHLAADAPDPAPDCLLCPACQTPSRSSPSVQCCVMSATLPMELRTWNYDCVLQVPDPISPQPSSPSLFLPYFSCFPLPNSFPPFYSLIIRQKCQGNSKGNRKPTRIRSSFYIGQLLLG